MSRTAQVYRLRNNSANEIFDQLSPLTGQETTVYPRIENLVLEPTSNRVTGIIYTQFLEGIDASFPTYNFVFDVNTSFCYMIGNIAGRASTARFLSRTIDPENEVISPIDLDNDDIVVDMFNRITTENPRNFIKKMKLEFGRDGLVFGTEQTPLYELEYRFVGNICASRHVDYDRFIEGAMHIKVHFGIWSLGPISTERHPTSMVVNKDNSFRFWLDLDAATWTLILDRLTRN